MRYNATDMMAAGSSSTPEARSGTILARGLGVRGATLVVVANMIGAGIFTTTGLMLSEVRSGGLVLLLWLVGGLIALAGALCYAELATTMPRAGAEYAYLRQIYGPLPAFLTGWTSFFVGFSAPIAASAVACAAYLGAAGVLAQDAPVQKTTAVAVVVALTAVHYCGLRLGTRVQTVLTGASLALLAGLLLAGFFAENSGVGFLAAESGFWGAPRWSRHASALLLVMFSYSGWNAAAYLAEEVEQPERTLPRSLLLGTVTVMGIYLLLNVLLFSAAPVALLTGVVPVAEVAVTQLFGSGAGRWLSALIALALLSSLSAYLFIGPRVYFAMARDSLFFRFASRIHPRFGTPAFSIAAQGACAVVMVLSGTFGQLLKYIGFALGVFPMMAVAGVILLRRREPDRPRPFRVWGYPVVPAFYLAGMGWILGVSLVNDPGPPLVALATVAAGIPFYWFTARRMPTTNSG